MNARFDRIQRKGVDAIVRAAYHDAVKACDAKGDEERLHAIGGLYAGLRIIARELGISLDDMPRAAFDRPACMCGATHGKTHDIGDGLQRCTDCGCH